MKPLHILTENYEVEINSDTNHGWFEHNTLGEERGGALWFQNGHLIDYDGVMVLPSEVIKSIRKMGYTVEA